LLRRSVEKGLDKGSRKKERDGADLAGENGDAGEKRGKQGNTTSLGRRWQKGKRRRKRNLNLAGHGKDLCSDCEIATTRGGDTKGTVEKRQETNLTSERGRINMSRIREERGEFSMATRRRHVKDRKSLRGKGGHDEVKRKKEKTLSRGGRQAEYICGSSRKVAGRKRKVKGHWERRVRETKWVPVGIAC